MAYPSYPYYSHYLHGGDGHGPTYGGDYDEQQGYNVQGTGAYNTYDYGESSGYSATVAASDCATAGSSTSYAATGYGYPYPAAGTPQAGKPLRYPRMAEDRMLERGRDPNPEFWQGDKAEKTWDYVQSGRPGRKDYEDADTTGEGDRELSKERRRNRRREESRDSSTCSWERRDRGHGGHKSGDKYRSSHHKDDKYRGKGEKKDKKDKHHGDSKHDKRDKYDRGDRYSSHGYKSYHRRDRDEGYY